MASSRTCDVVRTRLRLYQGETQSLPLALPYSYTQVYECTHSIVIAAQASGRLRSAEGRSAAGHVWVFQAGWETARHEPVAARGRRDRLPACCSLAAEPQGSELRQGVLRERLRHARCRDRRHGLRHRLAHGLNRHYRTQRGDGGRRVQHHGRTGRGGAQHNLHWERASAGTGAVGETPPRARERSALLRPAVVSRSLLRPAVSRVANCGHLVVCLCPGTYLWERLKTRSTRGCAVP